MSVQELDAPFEYAIDVEAEGARSDQAWTALIEEYLTPIGIIADHSSDRDGTLRYHSRHGPLLPPA